MLPPPTNPAGTAGNIVLVEEYSALATAFSALLKKFAPRYDVHVVATLGEAASVVRDRIPEILVIDVDPGHRGAVGFFNRLKLGARELRVLVIGAEDAGALAGAANGPAAFRFREEAISGRCVWRRRGGAA